MNVPHLRGTAFAMAPEDNNKALVRRLFDDVINHGDPERADDLVSVGFVEHNPMPGQAAGLAGFKQVLTMLRAAFPNLRITIDELVAERDKVAVRLTACGDHQGAFQGIPPTGRRVAWEGISLPRVADGQVVERWFHADVLGLREQLGAVAPGQPPDRPPERRVTEH